MDKVTDMITKSLDDIDALVAQAQGQTATEGIKKSVGNEEVPPEEVSEDTPKGEEEAAPEEQAPEDAGGEEGAEEEEEGAPEDTDAEADEDAEKSLKGTLNANASVRKALEVSEFLTALVDSFDSAMAAQREDITKSVQAANDTQEILAKSFQGMLKAQSAILGIQTDLGKSIKTIESRLKAIEAQPQVRKSVSSINTKAVEKSFNASTGSAATNPNTLSKSEASAKLTSAFEGGDHTLQQDILALEGTGNFGALSVHAKEVLGLK